MADSFEEEIVPNQVRWYSMNKWRLNEWITAISLLILVLSIVFYLWKDDTVLNWQSSIHFENFLKTYLLEVFSKSMFQIYTRASELKFHKSYVQNGFRIKMVLKSEDKNRTLIITRKQLNRPVTSLGPFIIGTHIISNNKNVKNGNSLQSIF